ncbi:MAG: hypothetical protein KF789_04035 [Bdellovibrionaceae bacterium]|nr:hypothetical protein [Pseudobdellovibrionaceae bacterium]
MKTLILTLLIALVSVGVASARFHPVPNMPGKPSDSAPVFASSAVESLIQNSGDDLVPWPWGSEMPFPWFFVQGVWMAEKGDFRTFFAFRVVKDKNDIRQLQVQQIDPESCELKASGVAIETNNIVRAQMTSSNGSVYRLSLRSFSEKSIPSSTLISQRPIYGQYVVLSLFPFDRVDGVHLPIQQISTQLNYKCLVER